MAFIKLKNETVKNELQHLQSQVNPHFFFNMLNNLYGLVEKDAKKAQQLILKLSDFVIWLHVIVLQSLAQIIADVLWMKHMGTQV